MAPSRDSCASALLAFFMVAAANVAAGPVVLDRVVATLDDKPVLLSEIQLEADLGLLSTDASELSSLMEPYLNRLMIIREVVELGGYRLSEEQEAESYRNFTAGFGPPGAYTERLDAWGVTEEEVRSRLERALLASLYTESRVQFFVNVLPGDIEKAYQDDPERWGGKSLFQAWEEINEELAVEAFLREQKRWMETLRTRYNLRIIRNGKPDDGVDKTGGENP